MAFDATPGGDPRGDICPKCGRPILVGEARTLMHFAEDPRGDRGLSGRPWHSECARPYWDKLTPLLDALKNLRR
jgi:hypothetical protein